MSTGLYKPGEKKKKLWSIIPVLLHLWCRTHEFTGCEERPVCVPDHRRPAQGLKSLLHASDSCCLGSCLGPKPVTWAPSNTVITGRCRLKTKPKWENRRLRPGLCLHRDTLIPLIPDLATSPSHIAGLFPDLGPAGPDHPHLRFVQGFKSTWG